jgi:hypothetical protein
MNKKKKSHIVQSPEEFFYVKSQANVLINIRKNLPEQIFRRPGQFFLFRDNYVLEKDFWKCLKRIAYKYSEEIIYFCSIDPDPELIKSNYNKGYPCIIYNIKELENVYYELLWAENSGILGAVNKGLIFGSSLKWSLYIERTNFFVAIINHNGEIRSCDLNEIEILRKGDSNQIFPEDNRFLNS